MSRAARLAAAGLGIGLAVSAGARPAVAASPALAAAQARARAEQKLVLLELGASWCAPCKAFAHDQQNSPALQIALATVVLVQLDAERETGPVLVAQHRVRGLPTFLLLDVAGLPVDRFVGYPAASSFCAWLARALSDPRPITEKEAALARAPTAALAVRLAEIRAAEANVPAAAALYRQARGLDPRSPGGYAGEIFALFESAALANAALADSLWAAADAVLASRPADPALLVRVATTMQAVAVRARTPERAAPYLEAAITGTRDVRDPALVEARRRLLPDHALYVLHDAERAARLQREAQPLGWQEEGAKVNAYAWWCLEHATPLADAEACVRHAVQVVPGGRDKAMLLDTLAELRARQGDLEEAARLAEQAAREFPANPYYPQQAARFRAAAAGAP